MKLVHTSFNNSPNKKECVIVDAADETEWGFAEREAFRLGGYIYTVYDNANRVVYTGNKMSEGLAALLAKIEVKV